MIITLCSPILDFRIFKFDDLIRHYNFKNDDYLLISTEEELSVFDSKPRTSAVLGGCSINTFFLINENNSEIDLTFFGAVGTDPAAKDITEMLKQKKFNFHLDYIEGRRSSKNFVILKDSGRVLCLFLDATNHMRPFFIKERESIINKASIAYISVFLFWWNHETCFNFLRALNNDCIVVLNLASDTLYNPDIIGFIDKLLAKTKVIVGNESEALRFFEIKFNRKITVEEGLKRISRDGKVMICTNGSKDVMYVVEDKIHTQKIPSSESVFKDTCGAGDFFVAGVLVGLHKSYDIHKCVEMGIYYATNKLEKNNESLNVMAA